jgi:hypothetical protein
MRTQLSDSSRIRFPVVGFSRSACLRRSQSESVRFSTTLLMTRLLMTSVEVSRCTPGRTKLASMRGLVPLRQEGACGGLASLASSPPCWQLGPRAAVGASHRTLLGWSRSVTGGRCADRLMGRWTQVYRVDGATLVRGAFGGHAVVLFVLFASRCHPVCGPSPTTRRQLPAVIYLGMEARGLLSRGSADPLRATAKTPPPASELPVPAGWLTPHYIRATSSAPAGTRSPGP